MSEFRIKRAILSTFDKTKIIQFATFLAEEKVEIYSTGGTYRTLEEAGIAVKKISDLTDFPEIMNGRVKTLHPKVFAGMLADQGNPAHMDDLNKVNVEPFQLVVVNLYPFSETYRSGDKTEAQIVEMIDIGGPSMLRASSKNYGSVAVLSDPAQYDDFIENYKAGKVDAEYRKNLAKAVFLKTALYDIEITDFFNSGDDEVFKEYKLAAYKKITELRYGENPDQKAAIYRPASDAEWEPFKQLHGKEISYNNYVDCIAAYHASADFESDGPVCAIIKHTNPCGFGVGDSGVDAYKRAVTVDPVSYFGGIVSTNVEIDLPFAEELRKSFLECIIAPSYSDEALELLKKKKNLRLLIPDAEALKSEAHMKEYGPGLLVQEVQKDSNVQTEWKCVTKVQPNENLQKAMKIAWHLTAQVKSNAIVLADNTGGVGVGAGQMSRVDSMKIAIRKAQEAGLNLENTVIGSDAYFPFRDSVDLAQEYKMAGVIQPGGSIRDEEVIQACDEHGMFMVFTGKRVFKH